MKNNNLYYKEIKLCFQNIQYYQRMITLSRNTHQRMYYEDLLKDEIRHLNYWQWYDNQQSHHKQCDHDGKKLQPNQRGITPEELAHYDGSIGRPAYVAVNGIVYDVSLEATWGGGTHFSLYAGKDVTTSFMGCHAGKLEVLRNVPIVGVYCHRTGGD